MNETLIQVRGGTVYEVRPGGTTTVDLYDPNTGDYSGTVEAATLDGWDPKPAARHSECYCRELHRSTCDFCTGLRA